MNRRGRFRVTPTVAVFSLSVISLVTSLRVTLRVLSTVALVSFMLRAFSTIPTLSSPIHAGPLLLLLEIGV